MPLETLVRVFNQQLAAAQKAESESVIPVGTTIAWRDVDQHTIAEVRSSRRSLQTALGLYRQMKHEIDQRAEVTDASIRAMVTRKVLDLQSTLSSMSMYIAQRERQEARRDRKPQKQMGFTKIAMGEVGYIGTAVVESVVDSSTAVVSIALVDRNGNPVLGLGETLVTGTLIISGLSTANLADDAAWHPKGWFKIKSTMQYAGRTYFVAEPL